MSKRITVQAVPREHHTGAWTPGRQWSTEPRVVEVIESEDDPQTTIDVMDAGRPTGEKRLIPDPHRIGMRTYRQIVANKQFFYVEDAGDGAPLGESQPLNVTPEDVKSLVARVALLEKGRESDRTEIERLRSKLERAKRE